MAPPPPWMEVMDDLMKGQEFATQLQGLLRDNPKVGLLMDQILQSFSRAIDATAKAGGEWSSDVQSEVTYGGSAGGKRKSGAGGDRRGACRRRTSPIVTKTMSNLDDGQAWRKYGQKYIQNSKHPRAYFRCTHKYDQQCAAQRQVQRCEDDDKDIFRVTYIGVHTCQDPAAAAAPVHVSRTAACHLISFSPNPNGGATPTTTASTTTTVQVGSGLESLKRESGDQEEVLSSSTPAAPPPTWPDLGDVMSAPHCCYGGVDFLEDYTQGLEYILPFDLDGC